MEKIIIASDFDGTITVKDSLFNFFENYANSKWMEIEQLWEEKKINSKECLEKEFELVSNLSEELIDEYVANVKIDPYFKDFYNFITSKDIDFVVISDGVDYFINKICKKAGIDKIKIFSNHGEFKNGRFILSYPNEYKKCVKNSGTCKCNIVSNLRNKYDKVYYIGDGTSDYCVSNKADVVFAKTKLAKYCKENNIKYTKFENFKDLFNLLNFQ